MPNIKSAIKRVKVSETKALRNRMIKSKVKTALKKFDANMTAEQYSATTAELDKAVAKGIVSKNAANRKKARLAIAMNKAAK